MISINNINQFDPLYMHCFPYYFPTIDFKFQNNGSSTAFLWQFVIDIIESRIDPAPSLNFQVLTDEDSNSLVIIAKNNGWGPAKNCEILLDEPVLNLFYSQEQRCATSDISSGETKPVICLKSDRIDKERFVEIHKIAMQEAREKLERDLLSSLDRYKHLTDSNKYPQTSLEEIYKKYQKEQRSRFENKWQRKRINGSSTLQNNEIFPKEAHETFLPTIPVGNPTITWRCTDEMGKMQQGKEIAKGMWLFWELYLSHDGFTCNDNHLWQFSIMHSDVTYCSIIDPSVEPHQRIYPISHKIPPRDVERFHIMIGASKSCYLTLRFKFSINCSQVVESGEFDIHIWNPMNSYWEVKYRDGEALRRESYDRFMALSEAPCYKEQKSRYLQPLLRKLLRKLL